MTVFKRTAAIILIVPCYLLFAILFCLALLLGALGAVIQGVSGCFVSVFSMGFLVVLVMVLADQSQRGDRMSWLALGVVALLIIAGMLIIFFTDKISEWILIGAYFIKNIPLLLW